MKFSAYRAAIALAAAFALLLAGCGGGGGESTGPAPDRNAAIKSANVSNVAAQAYWALDLLNNQINAGVRNVALATNADFSLQLCSLDGKTAKGSSTRTVDTATNTVTLTDVNCDNGVWVSNGTQTIKLSNIEKGDPFHDPVWKGTLTISFDFHTTFDPLTASQTGDLVIIYDQTAPNVGTFYVTNNKLQSRLASGSLAVERNISNLLYTGSIAASGLNTFNANFTLAGSFGKLGATSYDVKTMTDFKRQITNQAAGKPLQGVLIATAPDKSALTLTPVDATIARLEVDWNGDNVIDSSTTASWDTLGTLGSAINMLY